MDRAAEFSALYQRHCDAVLRYALRRTDPETARDITAETFLVAWRRLDVVPPEDTDARPWLYGVARKVLATAERSLRRAENLAARLHQERKTASAADAAVVVAEASRLTAALATTGLDHESATPAAGARRAAGQAWQAAAA